MIIARLIWKFNASIEKGRSNFEVPTQDTLQNSQNLKFVDALVIYNLLIVFPGKRKASTKNVCTMEKLGMCFQNATFYELRIAAQVSKLQSIFL